MSGVLNYTNVSLDPGDNLVQNEEEIKNFILAAFNNQRYCRRYTTGNLVAAFGFISKKEMDQIAKTLEAKVTSKEIKTNYTERRLLDYLMLKASLLYVSVNSVTLYSKDSADDDAFDKLCSTQVAYDILRKMFKNFEAHCNELIRRITSENFLIATSSVTDL